MQVVLGKKRKYFWMKKVLTFFIKVCYNISAYFGYSSQPRETGLGCVCMCVCVCVPHRQPAVGGRPFGERPPRLNKPS